MHYEDNESLRDLRRAYIEQKRQSVEHSIGGPLAALYAAVATGFDTAVRQLLQVGIVVLLVSVAVAHLAILLLLGDGGEYWSIDVEEGVYSVLISGACGAALAAYLMYKRAAELKAELRYSLLPGPPISLVPFLAEVVASRAAIDAVTHVSKEDTAFAREYVGAMRDNRLALAEARTERAERMAHDAVQIESVADAETELLRRIEDEVISASRTTPDLHRGARILGSARIAAAVQFLERRHAYGESQRPAGETLSDAWRDTYAIFEVANCARCSTVIRTSTEVRLRSDPERLGVRTHVFNGPPELGVPVLFWPKGGVLEPNGPIYDPGPPYGVWYCRACAAAQSANTCPPELCQRGTIHAPE